MKKTLMLLMACLVLAMPAEAKKKKTASAPPAAAPKEKKQNGLFGVVQSGQDWFFEIPDSIVGRRMLATVRYTSTPGGLSIYAGELVNQQTVYWEQVQDDRLMLRSELLLNVADSTEAINRAVVISNENPIIGAFKIESHRGGVYRVKVTSFLSEDNPALGLSMFAKRRLGVTSLLPAQSYIESVKTFPLNTEVRTVKTWASTSPTTMAGYSTGKVTLGLNISFVLLPKVPMQRRFFDPRVGYFTDDFVSYSDNQQRVKNKRFITRWRLEPKDSADAERMKRGELVEPKKPIVYYIDPATPKQWRPYLIQGVNDWQVAFERAGFKNAIMAKEWPENDSTMSMEDARFSVIRYLASPIPNAYGPQVHDPRSGEILESHICWYHNVMKLVHDWYMIQAGTIDEAARCMKYDDELMGQLIRFVSSHEVGHTLGLRHNFGSSSTVPVDSLRDKAWVEAHGHTPSIMDYARFNYVAQPEDSIGHAGIFPRIGDYDKWAIEWGYTPMWDSYDDESDHYELERLTTTRLRGNRRLWFGDGETNRTNDSRCQTEDLGDDAIKASEYGTRNLKRMIKLLPEWTYESNDIFGQNLHSMYDEVTFQFLRYSKHVLGNIGGVLYDYKTVNEDGPVYTNVSRERQKAALAYLNETVFKEPTWIIAEPYVARLVADPQTETIWLGSNVLNSLLNFYKLATLNKEYTAAELLADVRDMLFTELKGGQLTRYRKRMQAVYVERVVAAFNGCDASSELRAPLLATLKDLQRRLKAARTSDTVAAAHYASLADVIEEAVEKK